MNYRPFLERFALAFFAAAAATAWPLHAQQANEPAAIERTIPRDRTETPIDPAIETELPVATTGLSVEGRFTLGAVHVEGSTIFAPSELAAAYEPFLATEIDDARLKQIVAQITGLYRKAGYPLAFAMLPPQQVRGGVVRIKIVEGRIGTIDISGAETGEAALRAIAAPLRSETPLRIATLERVLGLMRDLPGWHVVNVRIARSDADLADHRLMIQVARDDVRALLYSDNRGTDPRSRLRFYSSVGVASQLTTGDEVRLSGFAIPGSDFRYLYGLLSYSAPLGRDGAALDLTGSYGDQFQRVDGKILDGYSTHLTGQLRYPLVRSRAFTATAKAALSDWYSVSRLDVTRVQRDRLRVVRLGLSLSALAKSQVDGEVWLARGLGFDKATKAGDPLASRSDAGGKFTKLSLFLQSSQALAADVTLRLTAAGQVSSRPLLSVEEFALGGTQLGRAYDFNRLAGDHGFGGAVEVSYRIGDVGDRVKQVELFGFLDAGAVFEDGNPPAIAHQQGLASTGAGARFTFAGVRISAEAGVPMTEIGGEKGLRAFVSASRSF